MGDKKHKSNNRIKKVGKDVIRANDIVVGKVRNIQAENIIMHAVKLPIVRVNRTKFLRKELVNITQKKLYN